MISLVLVGYLFGLPSLVLYSTLHYYIVHYIRHLGKRVVEFRYIFWDCDFMAWNLGFEDWMNVLNWSKCTFPTHYCHRMTPTPWNLRLQEITHRRINIPTLDKVLTLWILSSLVNLEKCLWRRLLWTVCSFEFLSVYVCLTKFGEIKRFYSITFHGELTFSLWIKLFSRNIMSILARWENPLHLSIIVTYTRVL